MPHCCPQKQQCVLTSRSGSMLVDRRAPDMLDRCGPNCAVIRRSSTGSVAIVCGLRTPESALRKAEQPAAAARTHVLIMPAVGQRVREPELVFHTRQVANHHGGCERPPTPAAGRLVATSCGILVKGDAELR